MVKVRKFWGLIPRRIMNFSETISHNDHDKQVEIIILLKQSNSENFKSMKYEKVKMSQSAFTCSKLTIETLDQGVKYVQS